MGIAKGDTFTNAKYSIAKRVYQDLTESEYRQNRVKEQTMNINYMYSIRKIVGVD